MNSRIKASLLRGFGIVAVLLGILWAGQGANLIGGSSMTGQPMWLVIGLLLAAVGVILLVLASRAGHDPNGPPGQH